MTFVGPGGEAEHVPARLEGGRWVSERALGAGESAFVGPGCVRDEYGNLNGAGSEAAVGAATAVPADPDHCFRDPPTEAPPSEPPPSDPVPACGGSAGAIPDDAIAAPLPGPGSAEPKCDRGGRRDDKLKGGPGDDCIAGGRATTGSGASAATTG